MHEAYLRLVGPQNPQCWDSRGHFFGAAAEAMRRVLVEQARRKKAGKRAGAACRVDVEPDDLAARQRDEKLLALDDALAQLEREDPQNAELIKLRYFAGFTIKEAADMLGVTTATADRYWVYARAWLQHHMTDTDLPSL